MSNGVGFRFFVVGIVICFFSESLTAVKVSPQRLNRIAGRMPVGKTKQDIKHPKPVLVDVDELSVRVREMIKSAVVEQDENSCLQMVEEFKEMYPEKLSEINLAIENLRQELERDSQAQRVSIANNINVVVGRDNREQASSSQEHFSILQKIIRLIQGFGPAILNSYLVYKLAAILASHQDVMMSILSQVQKMAENHADAAQLLNEVVSTQESMFSFTSVIKFLIPLLSLWSAYQSSKYSSEPYSFENIPLATKVL